MISPARGFQLSAAIAHTMLVGAIVVATTPACTRLPAAFAAETAALTRQSVDYGQLPLAFEANQGQSDEHVKFLAKGEGYSLFLTSTEAVLSLRAPGEPAPSSAVVRMRLVDANKQPAVTGLDRLTGVSNYLIGSDPARWRRDVPNYARVKYAGVYAGIDLVYYGKQRQLEYDFIVGPNADPSRVALAFEGVQALSIDPEGNLVLETAHGALTQQKPVVYQDIGGRRQVVDGRYELLGDDRVGFQVSSYDTTRPLVIDPVLSYSTYLGGGGNDIGHAIAVDSTGNAYVTGVTGSTNFPGASGSQVQSSLRGSEDMFITKLNVAGTALVYSTYLGGSGSEIGRAIAVDSVGNAYVTGETSSPTQVGTGNIAFPLVGPIQPIYGLNGDSFVTKLNAAGNALVYSTYLGGSGVDRGYGIALDGSGNAYITGHTNSSNFPTVAAFQGAVAGPGSYDAFVAKINAAGSALTYSTYLGGTGTEFSIHGGAIAVDGDGNAYVGGTTGSSNFPGAGPSTIQAAYGGGVSDGFVVKFNGAGSALVYSTYLGGTTYDAVNGIALDSARSAYVVGYTDSANFPTAVPMQASRGGGNDAFASKLNAAGSTLTYSTYLGGTGGDVAYDVAVDGGGNSFISGWTTSSNFPTAVPLQASNTGSGDAFLTQLNGPGSAVLFSTYWGANVGAEYGYGIALDGAGNIYLAGETNSSNFPTTVGSVQPSQAAFTDAFVVKIATILHPPTNFTATAIAGNSVTVSWTAPTNGITPTGYLLEGGVSPGQVLAGLPIGSGATAFTFAAPTGAFYIRLHATAFGARSVASNEIYILVNVPAPPSAPGNLLGFANGASLRLAWKNTAAGGAPTGLILDVTGSIATSLSLPLTEDFTFAGVPAGTYSMSVRASNSAGISGPSSTVTLAFPGTCGSAPETPTNLVATKSGSVISVSWGLPASGSAPESYTLIVTGAFVGNVPVSGRSIAGAVLPGSYTLRIAATNACGNSVASPAQTVTIP